MSEVDAARDSADSVQDLKPSTTKCICGFSNEAIDYLIYCDTCETAQHVQCYYVNEDGNFSAPDEHYCIDCKPRPIDAKLATIRQEDRMFWDLHAVELAKDKKDHGPAWQNEKREQQKDAERTKQLPSFRVDLAAQDYLFQQ